LSDFEKAALDEAKRLDISKMPAATIDSATTETSLMANSKGPEKIEKKGNFVKRRVCIKQHSKWIFIFK